MPSGWEPQVERSHRIELRGGLESGEQASEGNVAFCSLECAAGAMVP